MSTPIDELSAISGDRLYPPTQKVALCPVQAISDPCHHAYDFYHHPLVKHVLNLYKGDDEHVLFCIRLPYPHIMLLRHVHAVVYPSSSSLCITE